MKKTILATLSLLTLAAALPAPLLAHGDHAHEKKSAHQQEKKAGPNGGRVVSKGDVAFELFIQKDRHVRLTRLDAALAPAPLAGATATATGGERSAPLRFTFVEKEAALVSKEALPEGERIPLIVQFKPTAKGKTITERLTVNLANCPTCEHQEYACLCAH